MFKLHLLIKSLLHNEVDGALPDAELLGLDLTPLPLVQLLNVNGLLDVCRDLRLGYQGSLLLRSYGLLSLLHGFLPVAPQVLVVAE